jgi:hypothetical protein
MVYHNNNSDGFLGPFVYSFTSTGSTIQTVQEIAYDLTEPVGYISQTIGDSLAVQFDKIPGAKLDSIRVAIRNLVPITGRVLEYLGFTTQLGGKTLANITANSKISYVPSVVNPNGTYPYPQPYPNWTSINLQSFNITADKSFVVEFPFLGTDATVNRILTTYGPSTGVEHTILFNSSTSTWYYAGVSGQPTYSWQVLVRAYISIGTTGINDPIEILPSSFSLEQNYPNPFNPETVISFKIPVSSNVQIKIYDSLGREIRTLIDEFRNAGKQNIYWNSTDNFGKRVSSGVYYYTITAGKNVETKKMVLLK